jgi:hypothetical protein
MDNRLVLGRVHIVEWLNPGDDDTGRKRARHVARRRALAARGGYWINKDGPH